MAVPKGKVSKARRDKRRSSHWKLAAPGLVKCPKCGADVVKGKFGWYCKGKCGMNIAKVYGLSLSDAQIKGLLDGKSTSYASKGNKTIVCPEIVENPYNGKMYYQWKTERGK